MGICSSCLGDRRRRDVYDEEDEAQRLFDDPNNLHYGSFEEHDNHGQEDPQEAQREIEALQRVVARTSNNMIDVYDMMPQDDRNAGSDGLYNPVHTQEPSVAGVARYQSLLAKLSVQDEFTVAHIDWGTPADEEVPVELMHQRGGTAVTPVKLEGGNDALVATFSGAAAAMR